MSKLLILAGCAASAVFLSRHYDVYGLISTFIGLTALAFTWKAIYAVILWPKLLSPVRHLPGPSGGSFLMGQSHIINQLPSGEPHVNWMRTTPNNGLIRYLGILNIERVLVTTPETLREVLHSRSYSFLKPTLLTDEIGKILGRKGLLFAEGEEHKVQRKMLLPAFSHGHIKNLVPGFWEKSVEMTDKVAEVVRASGSPEAVVEMGKWCSLATLDIIGASGFGYDFRALDSASTSTSSTKETETPGSELAEAYNTIFNARSRSRILIALALVTSFSFVQLLPFKRTREVAQASKAINRIATQIITAKKAETLSSSKPTSTNNPSDEKDILSVMLKSGNYTGPDADSSMRDQLMTFLAAGHETTATAMIWALHELSLPENRHIQSRLRAEIHAAFPNGPPPTISYSQISSLKYLSHVTAEVLRLHPPVAVTLRVAGEDTTLNDTPIRKGTTVILSPFAINRSVELWGADAEEFRPGRWGSREAGGEDGAGAVAESNYGFLTFLAGPRGCIGNVFARVEFKCLLAAAIGRFEFEQDGSRELVVKGGIAAKPQGGIPVTVREGVWG